MQRQLLLWLASSSAEAKGQQPGEQPVRGGTALRSSLVNAKKVARSRQKRHGTEFGLVGSFVDLFILFEQHYN